MTHFMYLFTFIHPAFLPNLGIKRADRPRKHLPGDGSPKREGLMFWTRATAKFRGNSGLADSRTKSHRHWVPRLHPCSSQRLRSATRRGVWEIFKLVHNI